MQALHPESKRRRGLDVAASIMTRTALKHWLHVTDTHAHSAYIQLHECKDMTLISPLVAPTHCRLAVWEIPSMFSGTKKRRVS